MACFYSYLRFKSARFPVVFAPLHSSQRLSSVQLQYSTFFTSLEPGISFSVTLISPPSLDALASSMFFFLSIDFGVPCNSPRNLCETKLGPGYYFRSRPHAYAACIMCVLAFLRGCDCIVLVAWFVQSFVFQR